jgi:hypothetical protein
LRRVKVQCTLIVELDWPDEWTDPHFQIEENGCPGTGSIGRAIDDAIEEGERNGTCWACGLRGENKILEIKNADD